jgi:hypothetical protein
MVEDVIKKKFTHATGFCQWEKWGKPFSGQGHFGLLDFGRAVSYMVVCQS